MRILDIVRLLTLLEYREIEPGRTSSRFLSRERNDDRLMIDYSNFRSSLKRLEAQNENHRQGNPALSALDREGIAESVIRRFGTCYDCLWKVLKRYLNEDLGIPETPNSPKLVFRLAHENQLFARPLERWLRYVNVRVNTSHDLEGQKAAACLALVPDFMDDAVGLYQTMSGEAWEQATPSTSPPRNAGPLSVACQCVGMANDT